MNKKKAPNEDVHPYTDMFLSTLGGGIVMISDSEVDDEDTEPDYASDTDHDEKTEGDSRVRFGGVKSAPTSEPAEEETAEAEDDTGVVNFEGSGGEEDSGGDDFEDDDVVQDDVQNTDYIRRMKVTPPDMRITSDVMTMFEFSEVIGIRATQIEKGSHVFTSYDDLTDPREIAIKEVMDRKCPLMIIRKVSSTEQEQFSVNEMGVPADIRAGW